MRTSCWFPFFLLLIAAVSAAAATAQCTPSWLPGDLCSAPVGVAYATTTWDPDGAGPAAPRLVAGGRLTVGSMAEVSVAAYDGTNWLPLGTPPPGYVHGLINWNGALLAAASPFGGLGQVASWNGTSWQTLGLFAGFEVNSLAIYQGALFAAGAFTSVNGLPVNNIARWDGSSWTALGSGVNGEVLTMAVFNNSLFVGGKFTTAGGLTSLKLAVWNGSAWVAQPNFNGDVRALSARIGTSLANSYLFAGGEFSLIGGTGGLSVSKVARFSPSTNSWTSMGALNQCTSLLVRSTGLNSYEVLAGDYTTSGAAVRRWDGTNWVYLGSVEPGLPRSLTYYGGQYVQGTSSYEALAAVRRYSTSWQAVSGPGFADDVDAVLDGGGDIVIGGAFGVRRGASGAWTDVGGAFQGTVSRLAKMPNGDLIAAGAFISAGGVAANNIARWNGSTWNALGSGVGGEVLAVLPLPNGQLLVGGSFTTAGGAPATYIARWDGVVWNSVGGGVNGVVRALARLPNGDVVAGGDFTLAGGFANPATRVARWDGSTWWAMGPTAGFDASVLTLAVEASGSLLAGGVFNSFGTTAVNGIARWSGSTWLGVASPGTGVQSIVTLPNGDFYAGYQQNLARMPGATFVASTDASMHSIALSHAGTLLMGGDFNIVGGIVSARVAQLPTPCPATAFALGAACAGAGGNNSLVATSLPWAGGVFRATGSGLASPALVLVISGLQPLASPVPLSVAFPQALPGCNLLVSADLIDVQYATGGVATSQVPLPATPSIVGAAFYQQMVPIQVNAALAFLQVTATNALQAVVGSL